jgi:hypothetical protein
MPTDELNASGGPAVGHRYLLKVGELGRYLAWIAGTFVVLTTGVWGLIRSGLLPADAHLSNPDSAIISTKALLASRRTETSIAFVGDSSCLINIDIPTLRHRGIDAVNLGTLSYLSIDAFGRLAQRFCEGKPSPEIILVVHPECLRLTEPSMEHRAILESALSVPVVPGEGLSGNRFQRETFDGLRNRALDRWIPTPLRGRMGSRYGFTRDLSSRLLATGGTMEETATFDPRSPQGSAEYRLARRVRGECEAFRAMLPRGARLRLVISPIPQSHALKTHQATVSQLQRDVSIWLDAGVPALSLPATLPDSEFGTITHLLPSSAKNYSEGLARQMIEARN